VSILSIVSCCGRLSAGMVSDYLLKRCAVPRPMVLGVINLASAAVLVLFALVPDEPSFYISTVVVGFGFGCLNTLNPACAADIFGTANLGAIYTSLNFSLACASLIFGNFVFSGIYTANVAGSCLSDGYCHAGGTPQCPPGTTKHKCCHGTNCFVPSLWVIAVACLLASVLWFTLGCWTRSRYNLIIGDTRSQSREVQVEAILQSNGMAT